METIPEDRKCQYKYLGNSGLRVSNISLGTYTFGEHNEELPPNQVNESDAHQIIQRYVQWGGNFIDTANFYGRGNSERVVGSWLSRQERDRFVIGTKVCCLMDKTNPNARGASRRHITQSIDNSLRRLQTDYVDLYHIHIWDDATPIEETLRTLNDLVRCGKVRYLGASNFTGWQLQKVVCLCESMGLNPFIGLQQQYSLVSRDSELESFQVCKLNGLGVLSWSPLKGGFLSGKYKRDRQPTEGRIGWVCQDPEKRGNEGCPTWDYLCGQQKFWDTLQVMEKVASTHEKSMAQVGLRWMLQKPIVTAAVIGATTMAQLDDNMDAANGWRLTEEEMAELDAVSTPNLPYPYKMIWSVNKERVNPWNARPYV